MIRRIASISLAVLGLLCLTTICRADWVKFTSPDKTFEAQFPSEPKQSEQKTAGGATKMFTAMEATTTYALSLTAVPNLVKADADTIAKTLETSRDTLVKQLKGKLTSDKKVELDQKYAGREFVIEAMGIVHLRVRIYIVEGTLSQLIVGGTSADAVNGKDATMCVESFKLKK